MIIVFNPNTRRAMFTYDAPHPEGIEDVLTAQGLSFTTSETTTPISRMYVEADGSISELPDFPTQAMKTTIEADGIDKAVFAPLPKVTEVLVDGQSAGTYSDLFELAATEEGVYTVEFRHPRHLDARFEVTAV